MIQKGTSKLLVLLAVFALAQIMCSCGMTAKLEAHVYQDLNRNGVRDEGEPWFPDIHITWGATSTATDANGAAFFSAEQLKHESDCSEILKLDVHVPPGYELTEKHIPDFDCNAFLGGSPIVAVFNPGGTQSQDLVFGLAPIAPATNQPGAAPPPPASNAELTLTKTPDSNTCTLPGQTITYTYTITNQGAVELDAPFILTDDRITQFDCQPSLETLVLQPGDLATCYGYETVSANEVETGATLTNTATVTAMSAGQKVSSEPVRASVTCTKPADGLCAGVTTPTSACP